jgi:hypothetical protein
MSHLTKSALAEFEQCPKRFWLSRHRAELADERSSDLFVGGNKLGALARTQIKGGVLVESLDPQEALAQTQSLLPQRRPIFEAAFLHEGVFVRTDLLIPDGETAWQLAEVKASTGAKSHYVADLATQVWVAQGSGLEVSKSSVRHIDNTFRYGGAGDYDGLLIDAAEDADFPGLILGRAALATEAQRVFAAAEPSLAMGAHCKAPYDCPFTTYCVSLAPKRPEYPVEILPNQAGKKLAEALRAQGVLDLRDAPDASFSAGPLARIHAATKTGTPFHEKEALAQAVSAWPYPRFYLDFETINHVIPPWAQQRPFEQIPFQFSCHVEQADGTVSHHQFLDTSGDDPSRACAEALLAALGGSGAIVTYNLPTERGGIRKLAERCPDLAKPLVACVDRLVDLLPLVKAHYYHANMRGSYSIKAVLPVVAPELSYKGLEGVQDGLAAMAAWVEASDPQTCAERRQALRAQLLSYCELDTWAMVKLTRNLTRVG